MKRRLSAQLLLVVSLFLTACDDGPAGLQDEESALAALAGERPEPLSLHGLTRTAVRQVYQSEGPRAARELLMSVRPLSADRPADPQLEHAGAALVLRVFGPAAADRVLAAVLDEQGRMLASSATPAPDLQAHLAAVETELTAASRAAAKGDELGRLIHATRGQAAIARARTVMLEAGLPGLEGLVRSALSAGPADAATRHRTLAAAAAAALTSGDERGARVAQEDLRAYEVQLVASVIGPAPVRRMLDGAGTRLDTLESRLQESPYTPDLVRAQRAAAAARDQLQRAFALLQTGDIAAAADLGGHAVGLIRSINAH